MSVRGLLNGDGKNRAQLSLEFLLVYSVVLIVFLVIFAMVVSQRAATLSTQDYSTMQLMAQTVASEIDSALSSGSGYSATVQLPPGVGTLSYNISVSSSGVVTASTKVGKEVVSAQAYSSARNIVINGTVIAQGGGISVYQIPAYRGSVYVANSGGMIYLDEQPASTLSLAGNLNVGIGFNGKSADFNGQSSYIDVGNPSNLQFGSGSVITISAWIKIQGCNGDHAIVGHGLDSYTFQILSSACNSKLDWAESTVADIGSGPSVPENSWINVVAVNHIGSNVTFYVNGVPYGPYSFTNTYAYTEDLRIGSSQSDVNGFIFNGSISDIQIYNTSLSPLQIQQLYQEGINGVPISNSKLAGWWPLNGNANDYSGNGNDGAPYGVTFYGTAQINAHVSNHNGGNAVGDIVGFTSTAGSFGSQGGEYATYTDAKGNATAILTANTSSTQLANITVTSFNGNYTIAGNVVGWWPLNIGSGNITYDLSTHNNNGVFVNNAWSTANNRTSFLTGNFNGQNSQISTQLPTDAVVNTTISAFFNTNSIVGQTIVLLGNNGGTNGYGPYIGGTNTGCSSGTLSILESGVRWICTNVPISTNKWYNVALISSKSSTNVIYSLYLNGALVYTVTETLPNTPSGAMLIGNDNSGRIFSGSMSNVQVYNTSLSSSQIQQLYQEGINGVPISNSKLAGWWPLDGNANDYSGNNNNGTSANVVYTNTNYNITTNYPVASFNGKSSHISFTSSTSAGFASGSAPSSAFAWVYTPSTSRGDVVWYGTGATGEGRGLGIDVSGPHEIQFMGWNDDCYVSDTADNGAWHFVGYTYNGGTTATIWLDGVSKTCNIGSALNTVPSSGNIGADLLNDGGTWFNGSIANVQIYNTTLSPLQIQQLYQQGLPQYKKITIELGG